VNTPREPLLRWYDTARRDLPWRASRDPYRVWLSEVMLQQTTVAVVVPFYARFLARFPDLPSLAAADEDEVLRLWSGLGYYRRARNLLAGARHVAREHGGAFPRDLDAALAIPGVGPYTARAVLSIAYGAPQAVVDGNVQRVLARLHGRATASAREWQALADAWLDRARAGDWNQAVMELGATVCTPRAPRCPACPLQRSCVATSTVTAEQLPAPRVRRATTEVVIAAAVVRDAGRYLFVRRDDPRLMDGLWELPQTGFDGSGDRRSLSRELRTRHGVRVRTGALVATVKHAVTFRRVRVEAYRAKLLEPLADDARLCWIGADELARLPMSSLSAKVVRALA
jgi:A/G-specific adenine glycosylase